METRQEPTIEFAQVVRRGCGLDVHKEILVATIQGEGITTETRSFGAFTENIEELASWLSTNQITHVAMESTGVYWKPVFNVLGEDFEVLLVNARHIKHVPGRKTDKKDSEWLVQLLLAGLLQASFIPPQQVRELRDLFRYQRKATGHISAEWNRIQKVLEDANIKLSSVISDISGVSGRRMLVALSEGKTKPEDLLKLAHGRLKPKLADLKKALAGKVTKHHQFMLKTLLRSIGEQEALIADINVQIETQMADYETQLALLETIPGVGHQTAVGLLSEIGTDMDQFPSEKHLASWAGMAPGNNESAGKKSGRTTHGSKYLKTLLVEAAWAASHTKNTYLGSKYRALAARRGKKRALIAIGHKILVSAYHILKSGVGYAELGADYLVNRQAKRQLQSALDKLTTLGYTVVLEKSPTVCV